MGSWWYSIYFIVLGIVSFFTGEIVTFAMLSFVFIALNNINTTLKKIHLQNAQNQSVPKE